MHGKGASAPLSSTRAGRLPGLDLLRALAIGWVLIYHASTLDLVSADSAAVAFGWMGVDLFFVLSGYLIGGQVLGAVARYGSFSYRRFYLRRILRTLPAFLVVVGVYFAAPQLREYPGIQPLWQFLSFTENLLIDLSSSRSFSHVWSLCVEEQFYLLFPLIVGVLAIRPRAWKVVAACALVLVAGMALRAGLWLHVAGPHGLAGTPPPAFGRAYMEAIYYPTWTRLDGLLCGVMAAALRIFRPRAWAAVLRYPNLTLVLGVAGTAGAVIFFHRQIPQFLPAVFGFPLLSLSLALVVAACTSERCLFGRHPVPGAKPLAIVAYSLYLSHKMVFNFVETHLSHALAPYPPAPLAVALFAALAVGSLLYWLVERPFLKLRDRLEGRSRTPVVEVQAVGGVRG